MRGSFYTKEFESNYSMDEMLTIPRNASNGFWSMPVDGFESCLFLGVELMKATVLRDSRRCGLFMTLTIAVYSNYYFPPMAPIVHPILLEKEIVESLFNSNWAFPAIYSNYQIIKKLFSLELCEYP